MHYPDYFFPYSTKAQKGSFINRYRVGQKATVVCDEGYEIKGRLGSGGAKLECKEDGSWESATSSQHNKQFPVCKGRL